MPEPEANENEQDFISRCIPIVLDEGTAQDQEQAAAICYSLWREKKETIVKSAWMPVVCTKVGDEWRLEVLGAPYGGPDGGKDWQGEYFSPKTDVMMQPGDRRPVIYNHGTTPEKHSDPVPEVIGTAVMTRRDEKGVWFEVILDKTKKFAERIWRAAINGLARASTGTMGYLKRVARDGELLKWPIGELTLLDLGEGRRPANDFATVNLKAIFEEAGIELPEVFARADEAKADTKQLAPEVEPTIVKQQKAAIGIVAHLKEK